jgi:zinc transport system substrate-binding protein
VSLPRVRAVIGLAVACLLAACTEAQSGRLTVVAALYPLAFAAEEVGGLGPEVIDLTPPGSEAHDVEVSFEDRTALESAGLVLYLGDIGFQPQIERAVEDAAGEVVVAAEGIDGEDPHVWLDPVAFAETADRVAEGYANVDPDNADGYHSRAAELRGRLEAIDERYRTTLDDCRLGTLLVTHEAFGYLAQRYGLEQAGLAGLSPEGEPTAAALAEAEALVRDGRVEAVFYEETEEGRRIAEAVGDDLGISALPLATLESRPAEGDYLTVMEANLVSLAEGLGCG